MVVDVFAAVWAFGCFHLDPSVFEHECELMYRVHPRRNSVDQMQRHQQDKDPCPHWMYFNPPVNTLGKCFSGHTGEFEAQDHCEGCEPAVGGCEAATHLLVLRVGLGDC